jgi:hypothetical protein
MLGLLMDPAEERRNRRLASATIRKTQLGEPEPDDDASGLDGFELALRLSQEVWSLTGRTYERCLRSSWPILRRTLHDSDSAKGETLR